MLRYEALRADCLARRIGADDAALAEAKRAIRDSVMDRGPIKAAGVEIGWDWRKDEVSRTKMHGRPGS